jgi:Nif-specific regulatory protein
VQDLPHDPEKLIFGLSETPRLTRDLNALLKIATAIGGIRDSDSLQWQLLGFLFDIVPADRGAVMYFDKSGEISSTAAWDRAQGPEHAVPVNRKVTQQVFREREGVIVNNPAGAQREVGMRDAVEADVRSLLCAPMLHSGTVLGAIYLDTREEKGRFDENHLRVVTAVGSIAALALDNLRHWEVLEEENRELRAEINLEHNMIGESPRMKEVFKFVRRVAPTDSTVLIEGESGTGKELVARAIHRNSQRAERPFVAINCAAITETLLESELFGHEKGAFTGAAAQKKGKVEIADGGTLFLDEIGELAAGLQAKLLRVLQEREFERVGGTTPMPLNIRLIAATNRNLQEAIEVGEFRKDLYYRLNVVTVCMPALRDRKEDVALLAEHFLTKASRKCKTPIKGISQEAKTCLVNYDWPGNVRELENAIERAVVLGAGELMLPDDLPETVLEGGTQAADSTASYHGAIKDSKKQLVQQALQQTKGNYIGAAKILEIHPNSLLRLIRNLGIKSAVKTAGPSTRGS